jgi:hypothetical protein
MRAAVHLAPPKLYRQEGDVGVIRKRDGLDPSLRHADRARAERNKPLTVTETKAFTPNTLSVAIEDGAKRRTFSASSQGQIRLELALRREHRALRRATDRRKCCIESP